MAGHNRINMAELASLYEDRGFSDAETYIQSGNVVFHSPDNYTTYDIDTRIETAISERMKLNIAAMTRTLAELQETILANPFLGRPDFDPAKMAVIFLHEKAAPIRIQELAQISDPLDKFIISNKEVFLYCSNGFGRTRFYTGFFEKKLNIQGTARNWRTISALVAIAEKHQDYSTEVGS